MVLKKENEIQKIIQKLGPDLFQKIKEANKIADIGCAHGVLLFLLHTKLEKPKEGLYGFDVSKKFIAEAKKNFKNIYYWNFNQKRKWPQKFDVIFALDVIEHLENPQIFLKNIHSLMKNGGFLVLSTPNIHSFSRFIQGSQWFGFKDKTHKNFYCRASLFFLLKQEGLKIKKYKTLSSTTWPFYNWIISLFGLGGQVLLLAEKYD
ncbi:hypothetical protein COT63_02565 [Candidatus Shapirobacteria bacterium CG09_land_8_20_14_0_10_38_17]|uniref:Class I SAM-dependent methyltransferase n=1 Tax=Candidatus Shapirobacteria bacterium CG09_land_8_20_14_0_10_38_17 TaxID=1974884 RepID=A0A2H0WQL3_9BACT|nr:MAG: hypothetical protein COT63_02565 [Candidatus Shapirobacteria bacterium CG09_land_8_20_14_0_10_38_17]